MKLLHMETHIYVGKRTVYKTQQRNCYWTKYFDKFMLFLVWFFLFFFFFVLFCVFFFLYYIQSFHYRR